MPVRVRPGVQKPLCPDNYRDERFFNFKVMASVYILYSSGLDRFYTGSCNDLSYRTDQHLNKEYIKSFTSKADDWVLFWHFDDLSYKQARAMEAHIKSMKSKIYIQNLKKYPEIMLKLIEKYA
ncbi:MAG: GIY-YIG nuclease family protein [Bacteroidia bacterium]|nr:GIY-YIG nuclease family protein [Bacteroidia bacterium]